MSGIGILSARFPPAYRGGAETQAAGLARRLARRHDVTVFTRDADHPDVRRAAAAGGFDVVARGSRPRALRPFVDVRSALRGIADRRPRLDVLIAYQVYIDGAIAALARRRLGLPVAVWIRGEGEIRDDFSPKTRWASSRILAEADAVVAQSPRLARAATAYLAAHDRRPRRPVRVIGNGVDMTDPPSPAPGEPCVLFVGRLVERKGVDVLLDALAPVGVALTVVGDGPERAGLERRAARLGADVRFAGELAPDEVRAAMGAATALVLPARLGEGVPNVVLEAMACGLPVVASDGGGIGDLVDDGTNGLLVPPADTDALRAAVLRLLGDVALRTRLAAGGRVTASRHDWTAVVEAVEALVAELAADGAA